MKTEAILTLTLITIGLLCPSHGNTISFPSNTTYYVCYGPDGTQHIGVTETNQVTISGQPSMVTNTNVTEFVEAATDIGVTNWPALPAIGEQCRAGVYSHSNQVVACYQTHTRQSDWTIEGTPALYGVYHGAGTAVADWVQPTGGHDAYQKGDQVLFNGNTYESLINANVWSPTGYPAGWKIQ